jgi:putative endonuclease
MSTSSRNKGLGVWGEEQACLFLVRQGFQVIERNYHATVGEIDIVAIKDKDHYFIEVKTRHVGPLANDLSITPQKKYKFQKTIKHYCYKRNLVPEATIFAGLLVVVNKMQQKVSFRFVVFY